MLKKIRIRQYEPEVYANMDSHLAPIKARIEALDCFSKSKTFSITLAFHVDHKNDFCQLGLCGKESPMLG